MTSAEFLSWRKSLRLTQQEAGDLLGVTRRTILNYESSGDDVPKVVALACAAVTMGFRDYNGSEISG